jgi:hypothetical protein
VSRGIKNSKANGKPKTLAEVFAKEDYRTQLGDGSLMPQARDFSTEPISRVEWVDRETLCANNYNPNHVAPPEKELIILSILEDGWTQPLVVNTQDEIVDGFHRWLLSDDPRLKARYSGYVPITRVMSDPVHQQMSTIRHNRARGTHAILPMADIVTRMLKQGVSAGQIMAGLGMDEEEIVRLSTSLGMPELAATADFTPAWTPSEKRSS